MQSFFVQNGDKFSLTNNAAIKVHDTLPKGVYEVGFNPMQGYNLYVKNDVRPLPPKLYGSLELRSTRILNTYKERAERGLSTGVLLAGEKGSGKSLLARYLIEVADIPTVVISAPYVDSGFIDIIVSGGPKLLFFDEFEKTYDKQHQIALLSMLDGHHDNTNLIVATMNDTNSVIDAMKNRPSRFYYYYRYVGLDREFVAEYCVDRLKKQETDTIREIQSIATRISQFNFDMLQSLVEEVNRYGDAPEDCLKHMNIIDNGWGLTYGLRVETMDKREKITTSADTQQVNAFKPEDMSFYVKLEKPYELPNDATDDDSKSVSQIYFGGSDMLRNVTDKGEIIFEYEPWNVRCILVPQFRNLSWAI